LVKNERDEEHSGRATGSAQGRMRTWLGGDAACWRATE
jgi:hypothetical protein